MNRNLYLIAAILALFNVVLAGYSHDLQALFGWVSASLGWMTVYNIIKE